jgi:hypothetical protein
MAGPDLCRAWEEIEAVTIAAIEGYCLGGALRARAWPCDFRIIGEGAYLRLPEVPLGINMSWNSVPRVTTLAGPSRRQAVRDLRRGGGRGDLRRVGPRRRGRCARRARSPRRGPGPTRSAPCRRSRCG